MVTTRTTDRLRRMASDANAIADFVYGDGNVELRTASEAVTAAATLLAAAAQQIDHHINRYRAVAMRDDLTPDQGSMG